MSRSVPIIDIQNFSQSSIGQRRTTMIRLAAFLVALLMVVPPVFAETIKIRGAGAVTCAEWTKTKDDPALPLGYGTNVQWVLGFLAGLSHVKQRSLLQNTDFDAVAAYVASRSKIKPLALLV